MPLPEAALTASLTSSTEVSRPATIVRSTTEPVGTGARTAKPCSLPLSSGITSPIAFAAPVEAGTRLIAAARARRRSLCGASWRRWSAVYAWIVVIRPFSMPTVSCRTFATGARQLVVHDALEMTWWLSGVVDLVEVDAEYDGRVRLGRRRGDDHLLGARVEVLGGVGALGEEAGRLDHDVDAEVAPRQRRRVALGQHLDVAAVDGEDAVADG